MGGLILLVVILVLTCFWVYVYFGWLCRKLAGSTGAALVAFFGVFGASCVSLYSADIVSQGAPFFNNLLNDELLPEKWELMLTASLILIAVILIGMRELGLGMVVKKREDELENRISTLPPQDFLDVYGEGLKQIGQIRRGTKIKHANKGLTPEDMDRAIRSVMKHILGMARLWDGVSQTDGHMIYRSNIMMVVPAELMDAFKKDLKSYQKIVLDSPFFLYGDNFSSRLDSSTGLLLIENARHTVTSKSKGADPDTDVKPLCLPFSTQSEHMQPNLPGAPEALVSKSFKYVNSTVTVMHQWLDVHRRTENRYDRIFSNGIKDYYSKAGHAQSILSIPIVFEEKIMAVLNIYRNKEGIFKGEDRAQQFVSLMNPVCYHLAKMLALASKVATD